MSGLIRYLGATKDRTGTIVKDVIADELAALMHGRQVVNPGQIVPTSPGDLAVTHNVKRIFHAAAVYGVVGVGFRPIENVEQCITNALAFIDFEQKLAATSRTAASDTRAESILFPLLGAGTARADVTNSARRQVETAVSYLRSRAEFTRVNRVYFLGRTKVERSALRVVFAELELTEQPIQPEPAAPDVPVRERKANARARRKPRRR